MVLMDIPDPGYSDQEILSFNEFKIAYHEVAKVASKRFSVIGIDLKLGFGLIVN